MSTLTEKPSEFFSNWGHTVLRFRWLFLALTIISAMLSVWVAATQTRVDMGIEAFTDKESRTNAILSEFRDEFGRDDVWIVALKGDVFTSTYIDRLRALHTQLTAVNLELSSLGEQPNKKQNEELESQRKQEKSSNSDLIKLDEDFGADFGEEEEDSWGDEAGGELFEDVLSLINTKETRSLKDGQGIEVSDLFQTTPDEATLALVKKRVLNDPTIVGQMVNKTGTISLIILRAQFMSDQDGSLVTAEIRRIVKAAQTEGFTPHIAGIPTLNTDLTHLSMTNMQRLFGASFLLMFLILLWLFRHPLGVVGPLVVVMVSSLNTFGLMAFFGIPITMLSMILPAFIICVGLGDSVHLISIFRDTQSRGIATREALIIAIGTTGKPIIYTSLTTMIGLLSFRFASIEGIQQMGTAGAMGVMAACLHSLILLPISLSFLKKGTLGVQEKEGSDRLDHFLNVCNYTSGVKGESELDEPSPEAHRRRRRTLGWGVALMVTFLIAMTQLYVYHNPMSWIDSSHDLKVAFDLMDKELGGSADIHLLVDGPEGRGLKDLELLKALEKLELHMMKFRHPVHGKIVGSVLSPLSVLKSTQRALHGGSSEQYKLPDSDRAVADNFFLFESAGPEQLKRLATNDLSRGRVSFRLKWIEANGYEPVARYLEEGIARMIPKDSLVQPTGTAYSLLSTIGRLIIDLGRSFGFACLLITLLLMLQLQSVKLGLIAMVPNLAPIIFVMGFMALTKIPIDMVNLLIASIAIGIAVDDTIHLLHHFRVHFDQHGNVELAIDNAFKHAGRAMVSTSVILGIGFFAFTFATITNIQRFGLLISLTAFAAMFIDLIFTPALLRTFYSRTPPPTPLEPLS